MDGIEDELDQVEEALEQEQQKEENKSSWEVAHEKYLEEDNPEMLENMIHSFGLAHKYKAWDGLMTKKGKYIDYNEWHTTSFSGGLIAGGYIAPGILSGVFLTAWLYTLFIIGKHSYSNCRNSKCSHWVGSIQEFGFELPYYVGTALILTWFMEEHTGYEIVIENIGLMQTAAELALSLA